MEKNDRAITFSKSGIRDPSSSSFGVSASHVDNVTAGPVRAMSALSLRRADRLDNARRVYVCSICEARETLRWGRLAVRTANTHAVEG